MLSVTPDKYPNSVEVTLEVTTFLKGSVTKTRDGVCVVETLRLAGPDNDTSVLILSISEPPIEKDRLPGVAWKRPEESMKRIAGNPTVPEDFRSSASPVKLLAAKTLAPMKNPILKRFLSVFMEAPK